MEGRRFISNMSADAQAARGETLRKAQMFPESHFVVVFFFQEESICVAVFFLIFGLFLSQASGSDTERMYLSEWLDSIQVFVFLHFLVREGVVCFLKL